MNEFELSKQEYIDQHNASLVLGLKHDDFRKQKAAWVQDHIASNQPKHVLDFGFGGGELLEDLGRLEPTALLSGVEPSDQLREEFRNRNLGLPVSRLESTLENFENQSIDLMTCFNVLHHVKPASRELIANQMVAKLTPGGALLIWEHNPLNPGTQLIVCRCEYDHDAVLLRLGEVESMFAGLEVERSEYVNFTPPQLHRFFPFNTIEAWCRKLPLGAQYRTILRKRK